MRPAQISRNPPGLARALAPSLGVVLVGVLQPGLAAQMHHVDAPERVTRAVGVYEWTGDLAKPTAARFVPISLFINGHFEDAGLYLARPVPFALQDGDLYTVEQAGLPEGTLDLNNAERVVSGNALADDNPEGAWYGFGKFSPQAAPSPGPTLHRSTHPPVIQTASGSGTGTAASSDDDGHPHMSRRHPASSGDEGGSSAGGAGSSSGSADQGGAGDDTDRPTLARRNPAQDASRRRTAAGGRNNTASVTAVGPQPGDDPDRPLLTRKVAEDDTTRPLTGTPAGMHQAVAVSDAVQRDPHPFSRPWEDAAERSSTLTAMAALAHTQVMAYLADNRLVPAAPSPESGAAPASITAENNEGIAANTKDGEGAPPRLQRGKPVEYAGAAASEPKTATASTRPAGSAGRTSPHRKAAAPAPLPLQFQNQQIAGFTLSYGGLPTFVYTATAAAAPAKGAGALPADAHPTVYVTVVAQRLPSGQLQTALAATTDSLHLDRAPRMRLIDAVDPDASHRASLLFELRGNTSRQFALYRLTSAHAENTFTSASLE